MIYVFFSLCLVLIAIVIGSVFAPFRVSHPLHASRYYALARSRNFMLLGFIYFQLYGVAYYSVVDVDFGPYKFLDFERAVGVFVLYSSLFLVSFFAAYRVAYRKVEMPKVLHFQADPGIGVYWTIAVSIAILSLFLRFALYVPIAGPAINHWLSLGSAVACGVAAFAWGKNFFNPISVLVVGVTQGLGLLNTIITDFGRRNLFAQAIAVILCAWVSGCRSGRTKQTVITVLIMSVLGLTVMTAFTQARNDRTVERSSRLGFLFDDFSVEAMLQFVIPGDTAPASLWLIDSHPEDRGFEIEPLYSVRYFFWHYAPRSVFPDKPEPLSVRIPFMAKMEKVTLGLLTIGPGLMGHVAHDGGALAALLYGLIVGVMIGTLDKFLMTNVTSVFAVVAVVCAYAQLFGFPRGESPVFLGIAVIGLVGWVSLMTVVDHLTRRMS